MKGMAILAVVASVTALSACGSGGLADSDPRGHDACSQYEKYRADGDLGLEELVAVGAVASEATTDSIRVAAKPMMDDEALKTLREANPKVEQMWLVNKDSFKTICAEAGYRFS